MNKYSKGIYTFVLLLSAIVTIAGYSLKDLIQIQLSDRIHPNNKIDETRTILQKNPNTIINNSPKVSSIIQKIEDNMVYVDGGVLAEKNTESEGRPINTKINSFYISKYEITQREWKEVMGANPSHFSKCEYCPVENVSIDDAKLFISKLNSLTEKKYRLPKKKNGNLRL